MTCGDRFSTTISTKTLEATGNTVQRWLKGSRWYMMVLVVYWCLLLGPQYIYYRRSPSIIHCRRPMTRRRRQIACQWHRCNSSSGLLSRLSGQFPWIECVSYVSLQVQVLSWWCSWKTRGDWLRQHCSHHSLQIFMLLGALSAKCAEFCEDGSMDRLNPWYFHPRDGWKSKLEDLS